MSNLVLSARAVRRGKFVPEPSEKPLYLSVPDGETPAPGDAIDRAAWVSLLMAGAGEKDGILCWVHGYNNGPELVIKRHALLNKSLSAQGWDGILVSYDWPAGTLAINYREDRRDATRTAWQLVDGGIRLFTAQQRQGCVIPVHLLAHSAGAHVAVEAFKEANQNLDLAITNWSIGQVLLFGADVSQQSMSKGGDGTDLCEHAVRVTNYVTPQDIALKLSNVKRAGVAPRIGRVGMPEDAPNNAVNVNCSDVFLEIQEDDQEETSSHSWHFENAAWAHDAALTIRGDVDRYHLPTRRLENGKLQLTYHND